MVARAGRLAAFGLLAAQVLLLGAAVPGASMAQLPAGTTSLAPMLDRVTPAVVNISIYGRSRGRTLLEAVPAPPPRPGLAPQEPRELQNGSGVIFDARNGHIVSNFHVVENAETITVTLYDGRTYPASVVGADQASDIAVLKIDAADLEQIEFADSDDVRVGDFVVAIGNPFGLSHSVTSGIISGLGRNSIAPPELSDIAYEDFIQTDASINPGNSGGALVGLNGKLVGVNSAILSRTGGNIGIGFAIPVNMARNVMAQLVETGQVARGALGVRMAAITPQIAADRGLTSIHGALVNHVGKGSPAQSAGLVVDDVILAVNGRRVRDPGSLRNAIGMLRPGEQAQVEYLRAGENRRAIVTVGAAEETLTALNVELDRTRAQAGVAPAPPIEGLSLLETAPGTDYSGLLVRRVRPDTAAAHAGFAAGDIITHINAQRVLDFDSAAALISTSEAPITFTVLRGREEILLSVP